ncbi:hypothetical protein AAGG74_15990 [Bacillus mexicanus]|uniref:hypothetical protein n=1 Tax=Bacillus mexicanus TaxID=2834415 RepID=UPI003D1C36CD
MDKRIILNMKNGSSMHLSEIEGVKEKNDISRVWTIYDEKLVLENSPYNPITGEKVNDLLDADLEHLKGAVIEDIVHDWNIKKDKFYISSRYISLNQPITLLIELI